MDLISFLHLFTYQKVKIMWVVYICNMHYLNSVIMLDDELQFVVFIIQVHM